MKTDALISYECCIDHISSMTGENMNKAFDYTSAKAKVEAKSEEQPRKQGSRGTWKDKVVPDPPRK